MSMTCKPQSTQMSALETGLGFVRSNYHYGWDLSVDNKPEQGLFTSIIESLRKLYTASSGSFHNRLKRSVPIGTGTRWIQEPQHRWNMRVWPLDQDILIQWFFHYMGYGTARGGHLPCKQEKQMGSIPICSIDMAGSTSGPGHRPFKPVTGVQISYRSLRRNPYNNKIKYGTYGTRHSEVPNAGIA